MHWAIWTGGAEEPREGGNLRRGGCAQTLEQEKPSWAWPRFPRDPCKTTLSPSERTTGELHLNGASIQNVNDDKQEERKKSARGPGNFIIQAIQKRETKQRGVRADYGEYRNKCASLGIQGVPRTGQWGGAGDMNF